MKLYIYNDTFVILRSQFHFKTELLGEEHEIETIRHTAKTTGAS